MKVNVRQRICVDMLIDFEAENSPLEISELPNLVKNYDKTKFWEVDRQECDTTWTDLIIDKVELNEDTQFYDELVRIECVDKLSNEEIWNRICKQLAECVAKNVITEDELGIVQLQIQNSLAK